MSNTGISNHNVFTIDALLKEKSAELFLQTISGAQGLSRQIKVMELNRPGLTIAGFFEYFRPERIQILGMGECAYLDTLSSADRVDILNRMLAHPEVPCFIVTHDREVTPELIERCDFYNVPLLRSKLDTAHLIGELTAYLEEELAPSTLVHGVLVNVYGIGVLLTGESGIGKSECALELLKRGHMLVADDVVVVRHKPGGVLVGNSKGIIRHHLEVRGLGIIDATKLFGISSVLDKTRVDFVVKLSSWDETTDYDRLGIDEPKTEIVGVQVPQIIIPVSPGRNLAVLVEVAALNHRLKLGGVNTAKALNDKLIAQMNK